MEIKAENISQQPKKNRAKKIIIGILLSVLLIPVISWSLLMIYSKEIKESLINSLNEHLTAKVVINPENIEITFFESFPKAGIKFSEARLIKDIPAKNKELIKIGEVSFRFSISDLITGKYIVEEIVIKNSICNLETDKNGNNNFEFWKKSIKINNENKNYKKADLQIKKIDIINTSINYENQKENYSISCKLLKNRISGELSLEEFNSAIEGKIEIISVRQNKKEIIKNKNIQFNTIAHVSKRDWIVEEISLEVNDMDISLHGLLKGDEKKISCDLSIKGNNLDIQSFLSLLPAEQQVMLNQYSSEGKFYTEGGFKGIIYPESNLEIDVNFGINSGKIRHEESGRTFEKITLTGNYKKINRWQEISITTVEAEMGNNNIEGSLKILDLENPIVEIKAKLNTDISELLEFFPIDTIQQGSGKILLNADISGKLSDFKENYASQKIKAVGSAVVNNISLMMKHTDIPVIIESGELSISQNDLELKNILFKANENKIKIEGRLLNFFGWLLKENENICITGSATSETIQGDQILYFLERKNEKQDKINRSSGEKGFELNKNIELNLRVNIEQLTYQKFTGSKITGRLILKNGKLYGDSLQLNAFNGKINFSGLGENTDDAFRVTGKADITRVDIQTLFSQLNNFGQEAIQDKHLRGKCSASINFSTSFDKNFNPIPERILCESELKIENGELIEYKPLNALSKYIEMSELKRIQFNTLQTQVFIKNKKITLNKTEINNSAVNIKIFGEQDFDYNLNYHVAILMSEIMAKKPRKNKQLDEELKLVENDPENKRTVFLRIEGNFDDMKISYDRKSAKQKIKEDFKDQGRTLKEIFREEFGFIRKDTARKSSSGLLQKKSDQKFEIENNRDNNSNEKDDDDF